MSKKKIIIVDDDIETLELLDRILKKNFEVKTVYDPADLTEDLNVFRPDLIIIDHFIGCQTGKEIIVQFKTQEAFKEIPVVIHSGHEQIEQIAEAANASGFIRKPSSIADIRSYIEHQLGFVRADETTAPLT